MWVCTEVAARGRGIPNVDLVIHADLPTNADTLLHRSGRTGRAGVAGTSISFACEDESFIIPAIEEYIGNPLHCVMPEEGLLARVPPPT